MSDNLIICVFGRKGSGKTTLVREIIKENPRVFVIDSLAEYDAGFQVVHGKRACIEAMRDAGRAREDLFDLKEERGPFRLSLRVLDVEDNLELIDYAYEFPGTMLVVEETSLYTKSHFLPTEISRLVRYGRHREIDQIYVARRPSEVSRDLTAQADLIVSFQQQEPRDVKYLRDVAGEEAEQVRNLPKYKTMVFGDLSKMPIAVMRSRHRGAQLSLDPVEEEEETPP